MADLALRASAFTYRYPERPAAALDGLSLEVEAGAFVVLAGGSGSGKSTLLRAVCGLVPHVLGGDVAGEFLVAGRSLREAGPADLAPVCGTVLQEPERQVVMGGVAAEIGLAVEHRGDAPAAVARAVEEAALSLGVADLLERRTDTLSGGELQRVALAGAIAHRPSILVLDEPASQLDPVAAAELVGVLRRLNEEWGTTVLLAEHRLERCLPAADRVVALDRGRLVCDADPEGFLSWAGQAARDLATPAAELFTRTGLGPPPTSVKAARRALALGGLVPRAGSAGGAAAAGSTDAARASALAARRFRPAPEPAALAMHEVWHELRDGPAILRGVDVRLAAGERVVLMGRNGAGKSTLLRHAAGLLEPTRGRVERSGRVALLLQGAGDHLLAEHARDEVDAAALTRAGLTAEADADPRDLSGGERQRLALEVVLAGPLPAAVCLDEPTRGMDRAHGRRLSERLGDLAAEGAAVLVATHDAEFAAAWADRVVLMGRGTVIADGPAADVLTGGSYFATEVARVLGGAGGALTPEQGAAVLKRELGAEEVVR